VLLAASAVASLEEEIAQSPGTIRQIQEVSAARFVRRRIWTGGQFVVSSKASASREKCTSRDVGPDPVRQVSHEIGIAYLRKLWDIISEQGSKMPNQCFVPISHAWNLKDSRLVLLRDSCRIVVVELFVRGPSSIPDMLEQCSDCGCVRSHSCSLASRIDPMLNDLVNPLYIEIRGPDIASSLQRQV